MARGQYSDNFFLQKESVCVRKCTRALLCMCVHADCVCQSDWGNIFCVVLPAG